MAVLQTLKSQLKRCSVRTPYPPNCGPEQDTVICKHSYSQYCPLMWSIHLQLTPLWQKPSALLRGARFLL
eukprot:8238505-Pyramimonas_sp.AAC.1